MSKKRDFVLGGRQMRWCITAQHAVPLELFRHAGRRDDPNERRASCVFCEMAMRLLKKVENLKKGTTEDHWRECPKLYHDVWSKANQMRNAMDKMKRLEPEFPAR